MRHRGQRDHVYVVRSDGSTCNWAFPTYGDRLPHDLCHLVVENLLGIPAGFWGLVDRGMEVQLIDNESALFMNGQPLAEVEGFDASDLLRAEDAVASIAPFGTPVDFAATPTAIAHAESAVAPATGVGARVAGGILGLGVTAEEITAIKAVLRELQARWHGLDDGSIACDFG